MTLPFFPMYPADYMADTSHLTTEQHGAYLLLLMASWPRGGRLPNDPRKLARIARVTPKRWHMLSEDLMEMFEIDGDQIVSKRLEREHQKAASKSAKRSAAGKRGGDAKALKDKERGLANATAKACHSPDTRDHIGTSVPMKKARKRAARLPEDWTPPADFIAIATEAGLTEQQALIEAEKMKNWSLSAKGGAKLDWKATWRNWCQRRMEESNDRNRGSQGNVTDLRRRAWIDLATDGADGPPASTDEGERDAGGSPLLVEPAQRRA